MLHLVRQNSLVMDTGHYDRASMANAALPEQVEEPQKGLRASGGRKCFSEPMGCTYLSI